ncbi:hypothetical protein F5Y15DRAFT_420115 [Xylariaceae sp. FL0016]|nr:hypothetical protein F5Y15DRAFT_420115 [Xylariaceae sp. FL0016]
MEPPQSQSWLPSRPDGIDGDFQFRLAKEDDAGKIVSFISERFDGAQSYSEENKKLHLERIRSTISRKTNFILIASDSTKGCVIGLFIGHFRTPYPNWRDEDPKLTQDEKKKRHDFYHMLPPVIGGLLPASDDDGKKTLFGSDPIWNRIENEVAKRLHSALPMQFPIEGDIPKLNTNLLYISSMHVSKHEEYRKGKVSEPLIKWARAIANDRKLLLVFPVPMKDTVPMEDTVAMEDPVTTKDDDYHEHMKYMAPAASWTLIEGTKATLEVLAYTPYQHFMLGCVEPEPVNEVGDDSGV